MRQSSGSYIVDIFEGRNYENGYYEGRREAFAEAIELVMKEARKGEHAAPARQRITYTGGLRRAAKLLDAKLGEAMAAERNARQPVAQPSGEQ